MALAETAELAVKLSLGGNFQKQMAGVNRSLKTFDRNSSRAYRAGQQIGTGIKRGLAIAAGAAGLVASQVALGLDSLVELEKQTAQTNAVLKSTGGIAGVTADEVGRLAEKYESLNATIGDEVIREGENLLLTFTNINKDAFEPALAAALDLNTALGKGSEGLSGTVRQLGKALNDPTKGLSALGRVGITFTKEQTKRIKALQKEGKLYEAQGIILAELNKRFGGSFLAQGDTTAGKVAKFTDSIEDLQRSMARALLPAIGNIADALSDLLSDPEVIKGAEDLGREIGNLFSKGNIKEGARVVGQVFDTLRSSAPAIKAALGTVGTVLKTAFDAFSSLPAPIQQLLIGGVAVNKLTGGLVTNIAGGIFGALKAMTVQAGVVNVTGGMVSGGGAAGAAGAAGKAGGVAGFLGKALPIAAIVASVAAVVATQQDESGKNTAFATEIREGLNSSIAGKSLPELKVALAGVDQGIKDITSNPLLTLVQGDALTQLQGMRTDLQTQIGKIDTLKTQADRTKDDTVDATNKVQRATTETKRETRRGLGLVEAAAKRTRDAALETKREAARGLSMVNNATRTGSSSIVSAIYANRPIITTNVSVSATTVNKTSTVIKRYGPSGGSRNTDSADSTYGPS